MAGVARRKYGFVARQLLLMEGVVRRCGLLSGAAPRTDILKLMTDNSFTARETLLVITGAAIALLLVAAGISFYKHDYRHGILCFVAALVLGFVFFRKRKHGSLVLQKISVPFVQARAHGF